MIYIIPFDISYVRLNTSPIEAIEGLKSITMSRERYYSKKETTPFYGEVDKQKFKLNLISPFFPFYRSVGGFIHGKIHETPEGCNIKIIVGGWGILWLDIIGFLFAMLILSFFVWLFRMNIPIVIALYFLMVNTWFKIPCDQSKKKIKEVLIKNRYNISR